MFSTSQIITATQLVRNFKSIARRLYVYPEALLITQKRGMHLVLVNSDIYEGLLHQQFELSNLQHKERRVEVER